MPARFSPGDGIITCSLDRSRRAHLPDVQFSYPLKLIVPKRRFVPHVQVVWVIGYGGGLVAGDRVRIRASVDKGSTLVLLTQGSTKVFKTRQGRFLSDAPRKTIETPPTVQLYRLAVSPRSLLVLLPSPVTCFSRALYEQRQVVHLKDETSSLILLDWYTSGRMGMPPGSRAGDFNEPVPATDGTVGDDAQGEAWEFERYRSENEVWLGGERIAKDVLLLEDDPPPSLAASPGPDKWGDSGRTTTTYRDRVEPYSCYATLFLFGPACSKLVAHFASTFSSLVQYKQALPYSLVWSFSTLEGHPHGAGIARCAGHSTEAVKDWVCKLLEDGGIEDLIGQDLWRATFS
ncbi:hypothetical protein JCM10212_005987 [Sporobolomyces blumeae]